MPPLWFPWALLGFMLLGESPSWREYGRRWARSPQDRSSALYSAIVGFVSGLAAVFLAPWAREQPGMALPGTVAWSGTALVVLGTALRAWSMTVLGRYFTLTVQVREGQPVIERGPYRILRHPSYAGGELALLGVGLTLGAWPSTLLFVVPFFVAHLHRIRAEEAALAETLGEPYRAYMRRTWRLVPYVW